MEAVGYYESFVQLYQTTRRQSQNATICIVIAVRTSNLKMSSISPHVLFYAPLHLSNQKKFK